MGPIRRRLALLLGVGSGCAISVGSYINNSTGQQTVAIHLLDGWKKSFAQLTPDGARRVARQMIEWADAADKRNEALNDSQITLKWRYVDKAGVEAADGEIKDGAPVAAAT